MTCILTGNIRNFRVVKRLLIILLALQVVSAGYLPAELIKMGNLFQHFMEHRRKGSEISLSHFIRLHYFDAQHQASDPQKHASLPLQQSGHLMSVVFQSPVETIFIGYACAVFPHSHGLYMDPSLPSGNPAAVFQPPRVS
jgi:hypothetical protein